MTGSGPRVRGERDLSHQEFYMFGAGASEEGDSPQRPQFSLPSLVEAIWKQKLVVAMVWLVVTILAGVVVRVLPPIYDAEALVLLESQRIPHDFVPPTTVGADLWERLSTLDQRVLSHTQLLSLIETFGLYRQEVKKLNQEQLVERMRKDIQIELEPGLGSSKRPPAFRVRYSGPNPDQVAQVANRLAYLFIEQDLRERSVEAVGTAEFLESQLETARQQLETQESKLSRYKGEHNGELPEQEGALLGTLSRLEAQLQANEEAIRQAQQDKFFTRNTLDQATASADDLRALMQRPDPTLGSDAGALANLGSPAARAVQEMRAHLIELQQRYTENHPELVKTKEALRQLELVERDQEAQRASESETTNGKGTQPRTDAGPKRNAALAPLLEPELRRRQDQVGQLQTQLKALNSRVTGLQSSQEHLSQAIAAAELQIQKLPIREQEIAALVRDYEITKANYQSLLRKKMDADLAMEMEKRQKSEKFVLLDAARVPTEPVKPKVLVLSLLGSGVGLILGVGTGLLRELKKNVLLGEWELPKELEVLGRVPQFGVGTIERTALSFRRVVVASSILMLLLVLGIGVVSVHSGWPAF
jgi:polysaccharide chain length determinant protein (PEP-CTERM system associated)